MPPYTALESVPPVMPLGGIFILDLDKDASTIRGVSSTLRRAPWAPLLVVTRAPAGIPISSTSSRGCRGHRHSS